MAASSAPMTAPTVTTGGASAQGGVAVAVADGDAVADATVVGEGGRRRRVEPPPPQQQSVAAVLATGRTQGPRTAGGAGWSWWSDSITSPAVTARRSAPPVKRSRKRDTSSPPCADTCSPTECRHLLSPVCRLLLTPRVPTPAHPECRLLVMRGPPSGCAANSGPHPRHVMHPLPEPSDRGGVRGASGLSRASSLSKPKEDPHGFLWWFVVSFRRS